MEDIIQKAKKIREKYNPNNLSIFPYEDIESDFDDLNIFIVNLDDENILGATVFKEDRGLFNIYINSQKSDVRKYFTIAHELGHYFLHPEVIKKEGVLVDPDNLLDGNRALFQLSNAELNKLEVQANNFAMELVMPKKLVVDAWNSLGNLQKCAGVFNVPATVMSIRLEKLGLIS